MNARTALAQELEALADLTDQYAAGHITRNRLWHQEARVHRAYAVFYREGGETLLRRSVRALIGLDRDFLASTAPDAMRAVVISHGWVKTGELPSPGDPNRLAFEVWANPNIQTPGRTGVAPTVAIPLLTGAVDYPLRVADWAIDFAIRQGDLAPGEALAEARSEQSQGDFDASKSLTST